ncbi:hypothetical protein WDU94_005725 [Cyamophila willieti]
MVYFLFYFRNLRKILHSKISSLLIFEQKKFTISELSARFLRNARLNGGVVHLTTSVCAVKIVYRFAALTKRFATLTCHRCCYDIEEKCSLRSRVTGVDIMLEKNVRYAHVSQGQKVEKYR